MIVTEILGSGVNYGEALKSMLNNFKTLFIAYSNVSFIERYEVDIGNNIYRDIYEVTGFDKYYIAFQIEAEYNVDIVFQIYKKADCHTNNPIFEMTWSGDGGMSADNTYYVKYKLYAIGNNNILHGFTLLGYMQAVEHQFIIFSTSSNSGNCYICNYNSAIINSDTPTSYNYNTNLVNFNESEKALKQNLVITYGYYSDFVDIIYGLDLFINSQFKNMTFALIQVGNKRYRQVYENYIFVEDGDTE